MCCNLANGRVDSEEWLAYEIQLHGTEWIVSLSANCDQSPKKKTNILFYFKIIENPIRLLLFAYMIVISYGLAQSDCINMRLLIIALISRIKTFNRNTLKEMWIEKSPRQIYLKAQGAKLDMVMEEERGFQISGC